jgi:hypothetical protein
VTLMPKDLPLLQRPPLSERVFPWGKLQVTRLDLLLLQPRLSYAPVSLALSLVIRPDWATDLAQYKLQRIRLHKAEQKFLWS